MKISNKLSLCILIGLFILSLCLVLISNSGLKKISYISHNTISTMAQDDAKSTAKSVVLGFYTFSQALYKDFVKSGDSKEDAYESIVEYLRNVNLHNPTIRFFAINSKGDYIVHYQPEKVGKNYLSAKDDKNESYMQKFIDNAKDDTSFTEVSFFDDIAKKTRNIITFTKKDDNFDLIYGCTIDMNATLQHIEELSKETLDTIESSNILFISSAIILSIIILIAMIIFVIKQVSNPLNALTNKAIEGSSGDGGLPKNLEEKGKDEI
ncbi:cache domain-containing protein, partial [Campylobacter canadensis]